jgi:hypothetical protein
VVGMQLLAQKQPGQDRTEDGHQVHE